MPYSSPHRSPTPKWRNTPAGLPPFYVAEYALLDGALAGSFPEDQKFIPAPIAMFGVAKSGPEPRKLGPVAMQCQQQPGPGNPIIQPTLQNGDNAADVNWLTAKTVVQTADGDYDEGISFGSQVIEEPRQSTDGVTSRAHSPAPASESSQLGIIQWSSSSLTLQVAIRRQEADGYSSGCAIKWRQHSDIRSHT